MRAYVVVHSNQLASSEQLTGFLDKIETITFWYQCLPNAVFLTSSLDADDIATKIRDHFGEQRFLVMECNSNRRGWLPRKAWNLMRNPGDFV